MTKQEINQLATIVERFTKLQTAAVNASQAITAARSAMFSDSINDEEKNELRRAEMILNKIAENHRYYNAVAYFEALQDQTPGQ